MKSICFITPGHLASNPRIVKEIEAANSSGYKVSVVFSQYEKYLIKRDLKIISRIEGVKFYKIVWIKQGFRIFLRTVVTFNNRFAKIIFSVFGFYLPWYHNRVFFSQLLVAIAQRADLYIAHNLGALPVAYFASKLLGGSHAFDAEDFHRGESLDQKINESAKICEDRFLKDALYTSAASSLISNEYKKYYPEYKFTVINNVFRINQQPEFKKILTEASLKLIWFGQTVGLDRGLNVIIEALSSIDNYKVELTLVGNCSQDVKTEIEGIKKNLLKIVYCEQVEEDELFKICSENHIGLASENSYPLNRDLCLTNKVFTYLLSGNAILASDTAAQTQFMESIDEVGFIYNQGNKDSIVKSLFYYLHNPNLLNYHRMNSYRLGCEVYNWDNEKNLFLSNIH